MPTIIETINDKGKLNAIFDAIERAIDNGEISKSRIDESVKRIFKLKEKRGILRKQYYNFSLKKKNAIACEVVGSQEHAEIERAITQKSITVVKNDNLLPIKPKHNKKVLFLVETKDSINGFKFGMKRLKKEGIIPKKVSYNFFSYENTSVK
ncbi:MAG: hypothetical protein LBD17_05820 [Endomicrobium sp.]|jgi:beta-N-acetylhexosaminidase|nr:hypothetical protein [Endomicrobium sp.]